MGDGRRAGSDAVCAAQVHDSAKQRNFVLLSDRNAAEARYRDRSDADVPVDDPALLLADSSDVGARWMACVDDCACTRG